MKSPLRISSRFLGSTLLATVLFAGATAPAQSIYQTVTQPVGINWNTGPSWGTPAAVAIAGSNYVSGGTGTFTVRTHDASTNNPLYSVFVGAKLTLTNSGTVGANAGSLVLKNGGGLANVNSANIDLAGGTISYNTANGGTAAALGGAVLVSRDSLINAISAAGANRDLLLVANLSGSANLTVSMFTNNIALVLYGTNTAFSGNWSNRVGRIEIGNNALDALGSGKVILVNFTNTLTLNATNDFVVPNVIEGLGNLVKANSNTVTLSAANTFAGSTVVSNGVLKLSNALAITSSTNISLRGGTVDASLIGGLTLNTANNQAMNCNGSVTGNLTVDSVNALNFNVTAATNDILNVSGSLTLSSTPVTLNVSVPTFKATGTYRLINYVGAAIPTNQFNLVLVGATGQSYALSSSANQLNLVVLGVPKDLTWLGGGTWDTSSLNWTNSGGLTPTNFSVGDSVTFNDSATDFNVNVANSTLLMIPANLTVSNIVNDYTIYGDGIAPTGTLTKKGSGTLTLTSPSNSITGAIDIQAGALSVGSGGGFGALGTPSAITNNGIFRVNLSSGGPTVTCPVSGSGSVEVTNGAVLTLTGSNSYTGFTTVSDLSQLFVSSTNALGDAGTGTRVLANGKLGFGSTTTLSIAEPLFVNGTGIASSPGALYAINGNTRVNFMGPVTVESDSRFRMVSTPVSFSFSNTVSGANVNLWCTPGNASTETADTMTFATNLTLGASGSLLKDGPGSVLLNSPVNVWGSTVVSNGNLIVNGTLNGGTVTVSGGALAGTGLVNGPVDVQAGGSMAPGNNGIGTLTLSTTLANVGSYTMQINRTNVQNADKLVAGSIPVGGTALNLANTGPALEFGDSFDLFDGTITGPVPAITMTGTGFAQPNYIWDTSQLLSSGVITVSTSSIPFLPLVTTKFAVQPTDLALTWTSFTNQLYTIEYTTNLAAPNWQVARANIAPGAGTNVTSQLLTTVIPATSTNYTLVQYQMGTADAQIQDAVKTMVAGPLTQGPGVSLFNANANVTPVYTNPAPPELQVTAINLGADLATAEANQTWFTFTNTVGSSVTDLDLTTLSIYAGRGGAATPRGFAVYVTTPTTTDELVQGATDVPTARPEYTLFNISLTGLASLQNLTAGQQVVFKIVFYAPAASSSLEFDNITLEGNVSPGVPPNYIGLNPLFLRIKQQ